MITLVWNYLKRSVVSGTLASLAIFAFQIIACRVFRQIHQGAEAVPITKLMPKWIQTAFNISPAGINEINGFLAICYQHPFVLIIVLGLPISLVTAFLTGDVEKRTISLILARPVGRLHIVTSVGIVVLFWVAAMVEAQYVGCLVGAQWIGQAAELNANGLVKSALHLGLLSAAFTGIVAVFSATLNVRGDAIGWAITAVLIMYVWNFLAQIWGAGYGNINYSLFHFYKPTELLMGREISSINSQVLAIAGFTGWLISALVYRFKNFSV